MIDLGEGNEKTIAHYVISRYAGGAYPFDWTFEGSNNNQNWDILNTVTNADFSISQVNFDYSFTNTTAYRYYKLDITRCNASYIAICELQLMEAHVPTGITDASSDVFNYFPNPVEYLMTINKTIIGENKVKVLSISGELIKESILENGQLNLQELPSGLYILQMGNQNG